MRYLPGTILHGRHDKNDRIEIVKATPGSPKYIIRRLEGRRTHWTSLGFGPREVKRSKIHRAYLPGEETIIDLILKKYK